MEIKRNPGNHGELKNHDEKDILGMRVLILAAGYGTRLYPLITDTPKPLLPVADKPLINHLLEKIKDLEELKEVLVVTNDKFCPNFQQWAQANAQYPAPLVVINDGTTSPDDRLGSVGDMDFVLKTYPVKDDLLVIGGDNLFDYSLKEYIAFSRAKSPHVTIGVYDIKDRSKATQFGVVEMDDQGKIVSFEEKPNQPRASRIAMCFYYFPQESLGLVGDYLKQTQRSDKAGDYICWLTREKGVYGFCFEGKWYDIGSIEAYQEAQEAFKD